LTSFIRETYKKGMSLTEYLAAQGRGSASDLARRLGVSPVSVHRWKIGIHAPGWQRVAQIERATNGAVTAADFVPRQGDAA
jgi:DNA-binding transcriptional regulator YdaS (Cro superfamily)